MLWVEVSKDITIMPSLIKTPLYQTHVDLAGKLIEFHGWLLPLSYKSIMDEARAVRERVGVFDISHMGEVQVYGRNALELLQYTTSNDVTALEEGRVQYTTLLNDDGGILDDFLIYRVGVERYFLCLNATNTQRAVSWLANQALHFPEVEVKDLTHHFGMLSVQGPNAEALLMKTTKTDLSKLEYYQFVICSLGGYSVILSRTGYTGEDGFEIFCEWRETPALWKLINNRGKNLGLVPVGLGARDVLRQEMCFPLYGHELNDDITPYEAGLGWLVTLEKEEGFIGCEVLVNQYRHGVKRKLVAVETVGRNIARQGYPIMVGSELVGEVTSGTMSPTLNKPIALGFVNTEHCQVGAKVKVSIRGNMCDAIIVDKPFTQSNVKKKPKT